MFPPRPHQHCKPREWRICTRARAQGIIALIIGFALLAGCTQRRNPQVVFDHAMQTLHRGDMTAAASEAERGYKDFHTASPEWAWKFTILRARAFRSRGMNDDALRLLTAETAPAPTGGLAVEKLRWEGLIYSSMRRFQEAEQRFDEAERICAASDYPACPDVVDARGILEMELGNYAKAQGLFERVLASARASGDGSWEANELLNLSWSALKQVHLDEALDWSNAARQIALSRNSESIAQKALGNMGWAYYKLGDPEKAEVMFIEAKDQAAKLGEISSEIGWLTDSGYPNLDLGNFSAAEQSFQMSLDLARKINGREDIINSLIALAFVSEQTGKLENAKRYADEALVKAQEDKNGRDQVYPQLVQGRVAARLHDTTTAENAFREVAQSSDCPVFLKWDAERSLAKLYEDQRQFDAAAGEYRTALTTFETARSELTHVDSRLPFLSNASRIYDDYIQFLVARGRIVEALQVAEFSRARTLKEGLGMLPRGTSFAPEPLNPQEIASHVAGAILFYWLGEEQSYLWAITPQRVSLFPLAPAAEIKARVERYRKAIIDQNESSPTANDDGVALYRILVEPANGLLPKDAKNGKVFIIPDGNLNSLNFETLLVSERDAKGQLKQHYWIEDATIASASSLRILQAFHPPHGSGAGGLLLFGDAISPNEDFPQLPKAAIEMDLIKKHFPAGHQLVFSRDQANPPVYLASRPDRFSYIHFVAHGTASRLSPLDSAIVLSKGGAEEDSYKLYARDILGYPLHAELVTVSTCRSAGERAYSGEGLVGLSWAFVRAGAHNVIGALWDVSDASTPQFMDELYGDLKKGETPAAALRHAKLTLLRSRDFHNPFYWAPFQLYTGS